MDHKITIKKSSYALLSTSRISSTMKRMRLGARQVRNHIVVRQCLLIHSPQPARKKCITKMKPKPSQTKQRLNPLLPPRGWVRNALGTPKTLKNKQRVAMGRPS